MSFQGHFSIRKGHPQLLYWMLFDYYILSNKIGTFHPFQNVGRGARAPGSYTPAKEALKSSVHILYPSSLNDNTTNRQDVNRVVNCYFSTLYLQWLFFIITLRELV